MQSFRMAVSGLVVVLAAACSDDGGENAHPPDATTTDPTADGMTGSGFKVGGTVSGFAGRGLVLRLNDQHDLAIEDDGTFVFPVELPPDSEFAVTIASGPMCPTRLCTVTNGAGVISDGDVTSVDITCTVPRQRLLATSNVERSVRVVEDVLAIPHNNAAAPHTIQGASTQLAYIDVDAAAGDPQRDLLYVASDRRILVFDHASVAGGDASPARTITLNGETRFIGLDVDAARDRLYVTGSQALYVVDLASTRDGETPWAAKIFLAGGSRYAYPAHLAFDAVNDRLYVGMRYDERFYAFDSASTLTSASTPARTVTWTGVSARGMAIDGCRDRMYIESLATSENAFNLLVLDDVSALDGLTDIRGASTARLRTEGSAIRALDVDSEGNLYYANDASTAVRIHIAPHTWSGELTVSASKTVLGVSREARALDIVPY